MLDLELQLIEAVGTLTSVTVYSRGANLVVGFKSLFVSERAWGARGGRDGCFPGASV